MKIQTANFLNIIHNLSRHTRKSLNSLLNELGLSPAQVENLNAYLPWEFGQKALDLALCLTGNPYFGLTIGFNANPMVMGQDLGLFVQVCPDFKTVVSEFCRHSAVMGEMATFICQEKKEETILHFKGLAAWRIASFNAYRAGMEINAATIVTLSRLLTQNGVKITRLEFDYPGSAEMKKVYQQAFGDQISLEFNRNFCGVVFSGQSMQIQNPYFQEVMYNQMKNNLDARVNGYRRTVPITESIKMMLEEAYFQPRRKELHIDAVAHQFSQTVRHLQRELKAANQPFRDLRNAVKIKLADQFLLYKTNQELSDLLKFADITTFSKWFKTHFGHPPDHLRHERRK